MEILVKNKKKLVKLGPRGIGVFLTMEADVLGWKAGTEVLVAGYKKGGKKGMIIEKV